MRNKYKNIIGALGVSLIFTTLSAQQTYINKEWDMSNGNPGQYDQIACDIDPNGNLVYVTNNLNNSSNTDIFLNCIHPNGNVVWQQTCPSSATQDDYGADLKIDATGNIYVTGAHHNGNNLDYFVAKYDQVGTLLWQQYYNGNANGDDVPSAIDIDNSGNVYVTGTSYGGWTMTDIATVKYDNNGNQQWVKRYNFNNKVEVATDIKVDNAGNIIILGASANNWSNSDFIVRKYNANGNVLATKRHNSPGNGYDLPTELTVDANNNVFVVGTSESGSNKNIKVIAYNSNLQVQWVDYIDKSGNADESYGIVVDNNGDVIIAGYSTKTSGGTDAVIAKYSGTNGTQLWIVNKTALNDWDIAKARKVKVDANNNIYAAAETTINGSRDYTTLSYNPNGELKWEKTFNDQGNGANSAREIIVKNNTVYNTGITTNNTSKQITTVKYSIKQKPIVLATGTNGEQFVDNELLIRFDTSAIYYNVIDKKEFTAGILSDFVKPDVLNQMELKTGFSWKNLSTYKIFLRMTTADTISISRLGDTVRMDDFWATLSVYIPADFDEQLIADSVSSLYPMVQYADRDYFASFHAVPNDPLYLTEQSGLFDPIHGIEVETAWNNQVGQTYTKVGVYDSGINWRHEDYGDGTSSGTKIAGGWDYYDNASPFSQTTPDANGHGTATSGIIGALRNNNVGIAGIAGGDMQNGNTGCQLFSMAIPVDVALSPSQVISVLHSLAAPAIVEGAAYNPSTGYGYGLHIQNHSWGSPYTSNTLKDAVKSCYQNNCVFVVSSGNDGNTTINYPATYNDDWVLKVGANDATGGRANFSTYGNSLDVIAPGTNDIYATLDNNNNSGYSYNGNGTSFAAPMASGVSALLYSEHHPTNNSLYPNVLSPEDIEVMLQSFVTDVPPSGYDNETGYGRINTNYALTKVSLPYRVHHFQSTVNTSSATLYATNQTVSFPEGVPGSPLAIGYYVASTDVYKLTVSVPHNIPPTETYLSGWVRNSACDLYNNTSAIANPYWAGCTLDNSNQNNATLTGYIYKAKIYNSIGQYVGDRWFPTNLNSNVRFSYSIYTLDNNPNVGIEENELSNTFNIYPNPTNNSIVANYNLTDNSDVNLIVYDAIGRIVANRNMGNQSTGQHNVTIDLSHLSSGLYLVNLTVGTEIISKRIIKN